MFQSFETVADPSQGVERVARLREELVRQRLDGFLVPRADEHQGEYVAKRSERLQWLTGFTGSAGIALVLRERAVIWVDGRYTLQVRDQTDPGIFSVESLVDNPPPQWLADNTARGRRIGFDPWLHTIANARALRAALEKSGAELVAVEPNLVDAIWVDQPAPPAEPVEVHPESLAGEAAASRLARMAETVEAADADAAVLTDPASIAWSFNIRGRDVPHTPLALGFAIISADGRHSLYMERRKFGGETLAHVSAHAELHPPAELEHGLRRRAAAGGRIALDPQLAAEKLRIVIEESGGEVVEALDPARLPRATKNARELEGTRAAHRRDGTAVTQFLCWLDRQPPGSLDEIAVARQLEETRSSVGEAMQMPLRDISFDTISGAGPNGAIIHYRVTTRTSRKLQAGELYLIDSGAQYRDGTTDITRTVAIGAPTEAMRTHYTLVLKGMIGISMLRFPPGTRGMDIDAIARIALWKAGLDYAHGTGHGVGSYLSVHEGPQRIAKTGTEKLQPGMILSNEPGYYREGQYGIRLENLVVVTPADTVAGGDIAVHAFETLTLAPFDRRLVRTELLTDEERGWLDAYHTRVLAEIGPMVEGETLAWLEKAAAPL